MVDSPHLPGLVMFWKYNMTMKSDPTHVARKIRPTLGFVILIPRAGRVEQNPLPEVSHARQLVWCDLTIEGKEWAFMWKNLAVIPLYQSISQLFYSTKKWIAAKIYERAKVGCLCRSSDQLYISIIFYVPLKFLIVYKSRESQIVSEFSDNPHRSTVFVS